MGVILVIGSSIYTFKLGFDHLILAIALIGYFWPSDNQALSNEKSSAEGVKSEKRG